MRHKWYSLDMYDPADQAGDPLSLRCALIPHAEGQYMVFDIGVPEFIAPFRHGDIITASRRPGGTLVFGEVVQKSRWRSMDFSMKLPELTPDKLSEILGDYSGGSSEWDPSPGLAAVLDRVMASGGNWEFLWGSLLRLHLPEGCELSAEDTLLMEQGRELRITIARMRFNQRNGIRDPENEWRVVFPKRRRKQ